MPEGVFLSYINLIYSRLTTLRGDYMLLNKVSDKVFSVAIEKVDHRYLNHGVATGLLTHRRARRTDKHLTGQCRVVDTHIELKQLILSLARNALASHIDTVAHILEFVDTWHLDNVSLIVDKVSVGLNRSRHLIEIVAIFKLNVDHATMDTCAGRNSH